MTEQGIVAGINRDVALVEFNPNENCAGCATRHNCSQEGGKKRKLSVSNAVGAWVGDIVEVSISSHRVVGASLLLWVVPIFSLFVGYFAIFRRMGSESAAIFGSLIVMCFSFVVLKVIDSRILKKGWLRPVTTRIIQQDKSL